MDDTEVLFVDDDPDMTSLMKRVLEKEGYTVNTANGYEEALEQHNGEDIVVADYLFSREATGIDLINELEPEESFIYSGYDRDFIEREQSIPNETVYVQKPYMDRLQRLI